MSLNMQTGPLESDIGTEMILPNQNKLHQKPVFFFTTMYYIYIEVYPDVWCLNLHFIAVVRVFCCFVAGHVTKGSLGYLSSMYFSTSLVLGEVAAPFPEIES